MLYKVKINAMKNPLNKQKNSYFSSIKRDTLHFRILGRFYIKSAEFNQ